MKNGLTLSCLALLCVAGGCTSERVAPAVSLNESSGAAERAERASLVAVPEEDRRVGRKVTWISSVRPRGGRFRIARTTSDGETSETTYLTDSPHNDYKPVVSPDGTMIAFFRSYREGDDFFLWDTSICVMNADGSDLRELTDHEFMNTEPYWARDGSNRITWSRMVHPSEGEHGTYVFRTEHDARPGDEQRISATNWEWGNSSLTDGRVFVLREYGYHLLSPERDGDSRYEKIEYPGPFRYLHKVAVSNDETKIAYMKKVDPDGDDYRGSEIVYADFDTSVPSIENEVAFVPEDASKFSWYVSFSPDNDYLLYAEDGKIMMYDVESRTTTRLSTPDDVEYRYPNCEGSVK